MRPYRGLIFCAVAACVAGRWWLGDDDRPVNLPEGRYRIAGVDGADSIVLDRGVHIRLLGIAAPGRASSSSAAAASPHPDDALVCAAHEFIRGQVAGGEVQLQFDRARVDADGRLFGYVWIDDGKQGRRLLNEELLRAGLALAEPQAPCSAAMKRRLNRVAEEARREHRGLWADAAMR